eukprot:259989-Chlamydomonas_euryale.AAC.1
MRVPTRNSNVQEYARLASSFHAALLQLEVPIKLWADAQQRAAEDERAAAAAAAAAAGAPPGAAPVKAKPQTSGAGGGDLDAVLAQIEPVSSGGGSNAASKGKAKSKQAVQGADGGGGAWSAVARAVRRVASADSVGELASAVLELVRSAERPGSGDAVLVCVRAGSVGEFDGFPRKGKTSLAQVGVAEPGGGGEEGGEASLAQVDASIRETGEVMCCASPPLPCHAMPCDAMRCHATPCDAMRCAVLPPP